MNAIQKPLLFSENILIESMFWLQANQDEYFVYFIENFLSEIIEETNIPILVDLLNNPEILTDDLIKVFHENNKYGFLCRIGFPTYYEYTKNINPNHEEYHLKVLYSDTINSLERKIKLYSDEFKKIDYNLKEKDETVKKNRSHLRLVS